jgi:hypothetical protein
VHVVLRHAELLQVPADGFRGDPGFAQRRDRRALGTLGELLAVFAEDQAVMDELGRRRPERPEQPPVQLLVRPVVVPAHDVRDAEVDVVDNAREVVRGRPVVADERRAVEALAQLLPRLEVPLAPVALPHRPLVPVDPEPLQVAQQLVLAAGHVAGRVGVVYPQQHPVAERPVGDGA